MWRPDAFYAPRGIQAQYTQVITADAPTTTTTPTTTTPAAAGATSNATTPSGGLPSTGANSGFLAFLGAMLTLGGMAFVLRARRTHRTITLPGNVRNSG